MEYFCTSKSFVSYCSDNAIPSQLLRYNNFVEWYFIVKKKEFGTVMYILSRTIIQVLKVFLIGVLSSFVPAMLIFNIEVINTNSLVCFILLVISLFVFLVMYRKNQKNLYEDSFNILEYVIPTLISYGVYALTATILYIFRLSGIYNWIFLPTRFLEPIVTPVHISFITTHVMAFCIAVSIPISNR